MNGRLDFDRNRQRNIKLDCICVLITSWMGALDGDPRFVRVGGEFGPDSPGTPQSVQGEDKKSKAVCETSYRELNVTSTKESLFH